MPVDVVSPLIGLAGVAVGAAVQWFAATRNQRTQFNVEATRETRDYLVRVLKAADMLHLTQGLALDELHRSAIAAIDADGRSPGSVLVDGHIKLNPELQARVDAALAEWRAILTMRYLLAPPPVSNDLTALDEIRAHVIEAARTGNITRAQTINDGQFAMQLAQLKRGTGVAAARSNVILSRSLINWWNRSERKAVQKAFVDEATKYNDALERDPSTERAHNGS